MNVGASGGERKKMEIVSMMMMNPRLAFLDEIDSGLDIDALQAVSKGIQEFLKSKKNAVILVSHSPGILQYLSPTHVHVFCGGHISKTGGPDLAKRIHTEGYGGFLDCERCKEL
jgi:Fe-S cluster assembly ATP-binding protein